MRKLSNGFFKNIIMVLSGSVVAQIIALVASPVIAKLYSPADLGLYSNYNAIFTIFSVVVCLQFEMAIVLPEKDSDAMSVYKTTQIVSVIITFVSIVLVFLFTDVLVNALNAEGLENLLWLLPISIMLEGLHKGYRYLLVRTNDMKSVATANALSSITTSLSQIAFGFKAIALNGGMMFGTIIGHTFQNLFMWQKLKKFRSAHRSQRFGITQFKAVVSRYRNFPLYSGPAALMDSLSTSLPSLLLAAFYNSTIVGCYALCYRILSMPISLISGSIAQAFLPEAVKYKKKGILGEKSLELARNLMRLGFTPMLLITLASEPLISLFFGPEWLLTSVFMRSLGVWLALIFVYSPLSYLFSITERLKEFTKLRLMILIVRTVILVFSGMNYSANVTILLFGVSGAVLATISIIYSLRQADIKTGQTLLCILSELLHSVLYLIPTLAVIIIYGNEYISLGTAVLSGVVFLIIEGKQKLKSMRKTGEGGAE